MHGCDHTFKNIYIKRYIKLVENKLCKNSLVLLKTLWFYHKHYYIKSSVVTMLIIPILNTVPQMLRNFELHALHDKTT